MPNAPCLHPAAWPRRSLNALRNPQATHLQTYPATLAFSVADIPHNHRTGYNRSYGCNKICNCRSIARGMQVAEGVLNSPLGQHLIDVVKPSPVLASIELEAVATTWRTLASQDRPRSTSGPADFPYCGACDTNAGTERFLAADAAGDVLSPCVRKV